MNLYDLGRNSCYGKLSDMPSIDEAKQAVEIDLRKIEDYVKSRLRI